MEIVAVALVLVAGFIIGVILAGSVAAAVKDVEHKLHARMDKALEDVQKAFALVSDDAEKFNTRLKAIEHNIDVKIASQIAGHQS